MTKLIAAGFTPLSGGVTATRAADNVQGIGALLAAFKNAAGVSHVIKFTVNQINPSNALILDANDNTLNNRIAQFYTATGSTVGFRDVASAVSSNPGNSGATTIGVQQKLGRTVKAGNDVVSLNGSLAAQSFPASVPNTAITQMGIGQQLTGGSGALQLDAVVSRITTMSALLTVSQLNALTA